jgi:hypothetical protein
VPTVQVFEQIASFTDACGRYDLVALARLLREAVPEFEPLDARENRSANATVVAFPARQSRKI